MFTLNAFFQSMLGYEKWNFAYAQIHDRSS